MTDDAKKATKYIKNIKFPRLTILIAMDLLIPLAFSVGFSNFVFLLLFGIPSIIATFMPGGIKYRRAEIINFISTILECIIFATGILISREYEISNILYMSLAIAISFTFAARILIYRVLKMSLQKAVVRSSIRLLIAFFFFSFLNLGDIKFMGERLVLIVSMFTLIMVVFVYLLSKPFEKTIGINPFDIVFAFANDWIHGTNTIETSLIKESEEGKAVINIINFTGKDGNLKANFIIPYVHPGPFGNVGSANMPKIFHEGIERSLTFHGSCTHELNLIKNSDVYSLMDDIKKEIQNISGNDENVSTKYGKFISDGKISVLQVDSTDLKRVVFCDGDGDIDVGIGLACSDVFIDLHSSGNDDETITASTKRGMEIINKARNLRADLKEIESRKIQLGIAEGTVQDCDVQVAFFDLNEPYALLLFDSNNMQNREILDILRQKFKFTIFACTTDDHQRDNGKFMIEIAEDDVNSISNLIEKAMNDTSDVCVKFGKIERNVKVMGKEYEMLQAANFMTVMLKFLLPFLIFIMAFFVFVAIVML
ncbi:MAG: DUF2070 family protein [Candidatus Altiarchaeum hamiconexum]|uniref:DUF2070 family protein n=1 Tax=Candidatus Altarchaeum hamiconexum TaxID=1803513 RepID=A0A8J8CH21_9ARCH|nr:DUF2070 family protein [Candidatus Altarchaeum hamiconexum]OIQ05950.1 MAG: hypothetical protein AUK59_01775 [Candidatus Altarchaeum sp. CG2_30_32_3053]PIN68076.1 MAG: hypothetical protein COV98_00580 [Candidatus Altarchaeum sp. CG12_big_fil_rev_8_21_14_0_65_33_22]PIV27545.1 MAG: hypothetical protein COS36_05330 [Candidatus Altarchaeum sp. CG03_land_8_20_14_0_80_32_618]PIX49497.1 MAG: hypothetical protein COZ53_00420 [Candidatus Altarchaeum sp. CG_4_8_14_3_um_filter_33_2054]PIZ31852.1 MAG: h